MLTVDGHMHGQSDGFSEIHRIDKQGKSAT